MNTATTTAILIVTDRRLAHSDAERLRKTLALESAQAWNGQDAIAPNTLAVVDGANFQGCMDGQIAYLQPGLEFQQRNANTTKASPMKSTTAILAFILAAFAVVGTIDYQVAADAAAEHYAAAHRAPLGSFDTPEHLAGEHDGESVPRTGVEVLATAKPVFDQAGREISAPVEVGGVDELRVLNH